MPPLLDSPSNPTSLSSSGGEIRRCEPPETLTAEENFVPEPKLQPSNTFDDWMDSLGMDAFRLEETKKEDEDCRSGYFSKSDFVEANWSHAATYVPPIGIAVVAGGLAICAPVTFLLGAVAAFTTVGTVHAAAATYEFCVDASCCGLYSNEIELKADESPQVKDGVSQITFTMGGDESLESDDEADDASHGHESVRSAHGQDPSALQTKQEVSEWVQLYYPTLKHTAKENMEFVGLNALEFFEVFFDNNAPYTLKEFQRKRGDQDIQYGQWENLHHVQQPSLHGKAKSCPDLPSMVRERILNFKVKNISYFGPPYVPATKVQRALVASKRLLVLESKNSVSDVPFSDRFFVLERWVVTAEKKDDGLYHLSVSIYSEAFFTKKCAFESQIVSKSEASFKDVAKQWNIMAQEALKLTEKTRSRRIRSKLKAQGLDLDCEDQEAVQTENGGEQECEGVEVRHIGRCKSWVVGDGEPETETPLKRKNSLVRVSQSISKFVRRRSSDVSLKRSTSQTSVKI